MKTLPQKASAIIITICLTVLFSSCSLNTPISSQDATLPFYKSTKIHLATPEKAKMLLATEDTYIKNLTQFDLESKVGSPDKTVTGYVEFAQNNVIEWEEQDLASIKKCVERISIRFKDMNLNVFLPNDIYLIKSNCLEEGETYGYTRENFIVLNDGHADLDVISHEMFHILTRYNPDKRDKIYQSLGFHETSNYTIPKEIHQQIITNSDTPANNYSIRLNVNNNPIDAVLILYSPKPYTGGSLGEYMNTKLFVPSTSFMFNIDDVAGFYEQVGRNTTYTIHPEEISAEHFRMIIQNQKEYVNPELIRSLESILSTEVR